MSKRRFYFQSLGCSLVLSWNEYLLQYSHITQPQNLSIHTKPTSILVGAPKILNHHIYHFQTLLSSSYEEEEATKWADNNSDFSNSKK